MLPLSSYSDILHLAITQAVTDATFATLWRAQRDGCETSSLMRIRKELLSESTHQVTSAPIHLRLSNPQRGVDFSYAHKA